MPGKPPVPPRDPTDGDGALSEPCPICGKPASRATRPFCSKRCANVDLNRWLTGAYAIPGAEEEDEDGGPQEAGGEA